MLSSQKAFRKNELEDLIKTFKEKLLFPHEAKENNTIKITEDLILAFQKLAEVIEHYQDFFDNALQGIFIATIKGKVIACNPECAKMLGHESNEELIGKKDFIRTYFYDPKEASNLNNKLRETGELKNTEYLLNLASAYHLDQKLEKANEYYKAVLDLDPNNKAAKEGYLRTKPR